MRASVLHHLERRDSSKAEGSKEASAATTLPPTKRKSRECDPRPGKRPATNESPKVWDLRGQKAPPLAVTKARD